MSINSELMARLARLGPVRVADPPPSFSGADVTLVLRRVGKLDRPVDLVHRLRAAGMTLRAAHAIGCQIREQPFAVARIREGAGIEALAADLLSMNVRVERRRRPEPGLIAEVRKRHDLSQREFADLLGVELDTLQNWEQGRNRPDAAALSLAMAFDAAPETIQAAMFEPVT
jgi:DNA-binding transcriptional regulator YiaG